MPKKYYRDRVNTYREVLDFVCASKQPLTEWRLSYATHGAGQFFNAITREMKEFGLIKATPAFSKRQQHSERKYGEIGTTVNPKTKYITITPKGLRFLKVSDGLAKLMPTAPWLIENAGWIPNRIGKEMSSSPS